MKALPAASCRSGQNYRTVVGNQDAVYTFVQNTTNQSQFRTSTGELVEFHITYKMVPVDNGGVPDPVATERPEVSDNVAAILDMKYSQAQGVIAQLSDEELRELDRVDPRMWVGQLVAGELMRRREKPDADAEGAEPAATATTATATESGTAADTIDVDHELAALHSAFDGLKGGALSEQIRGWSFLAPLKRWEELSVEFTASHQKQIDQQLRWLQKVADGDMAQCRKMAKQTTVANMPGVLVAVQRRLDELSMAEAEPADAQNQPSGASDEGSTEPEPQTPDVTPSPCQYVLVDQGNRVCGAEGTAKEEPGHYRGITFCSEHMASVIERDEILARSEARKEEGGRAADITVADEPRESEPGEPSAPGDLIEITVTLAEPAPDKVNQTRCSCGEPMPTEGIGAWHRHYCPCGHTWVWDSSQRFYALASGQETDEAREDPPIDDDPYGTAKADADVRTAIGGALDNHGLSLGVPRKIETDADYRTRLENEQLLAAALPAADDEVDATSMGIRILTTSAALAALSELMLHLPVLREQGIEVTIATAEL